MRSRSRSDRDAAPAPVRRLVVVSHDARGPWPNLVAIASASLNARGVLPKSEKRIEEHHRSFLEFLRELRWSFLDVLVAVAPRPPAPAPAPARLRHRPRRQRQRRATAHESTAHPHPAHTTPLVSVAVAFGRPRQADLRAHATLGRDYLRRHAGNHRSQLSARPSPDTPLELWENFSQLLILEATNDRSLVNLVEHERIWNFFQEEKDFPCDIDTTSLGCVILQRSASVALSIISEMLEYVNAEGIMLTYFDHNRPRVDPIVCINALTLFYSHNQGHLLSKSLDWIHSILLNRSYLSGTRYYSTPESFLFFLARLLAQTNDPELHAKLVPVLRARVLERVGVPSGNDDDDDALVLAMRVLACDFVGFRNEVDLGRLLALQRADGSWETSWIYRLPTVGVQIGNKGLTTALATKALSVLAFETPLSRRATL